MRVRYLSSLLLVPALLLAACGGESDADTDADTEGHAITIGVFRGAPVSAMDRVAQEQGFFAEQGLDAELVDFPSGAEMVAAALGGSADFFTGGTTLVWPLMKQGDCFRYVAAGERNYSNLIARPGVVGDGGSVADLKGAKIGVPARGAAAEQWFRLVLEEGGLDPDTDVTFIGTGGITTALPAFEEGQVDATISFPPMEQLLGADGFDMVADVVGGETHALDNLMQAGMVVSCSFAEENPEAVDAYCTAIDQAYAFARDPKNSVEMGALTQEMLSLESPEQAQAVWESVVPTYPGPELSKELWDAQSKFAPADLEGWIPPYEESVLSDCGTS